jgi:hypothetical protein
MVSRAVALAAGTDNITLPLCIFAQPCNPNTARQDFLTPSCLAINIFAPFQSEICCGSASLESFAIADTDIGV